MTCILSSQGSNFYKTEVKLPAVITSPENSNVAMCDLTGAR